MNIIVILSDTFRKDHLGCYGNPRIKTPNLDRFSEECVQFDNCYAASFPTVPMRADLFTGRFTFTYLGWNPLPLEERVLAQCLQEAGYVTLAALDTPFLVRNGYGYDRGFGDFSQIQGQTFAEPQSERPGDRARINAERHYEKDWCPAKTMTAAEKHVEHYYKEKFFLYVDTWDPHEPWDPPPWYVDPYYPGYDGRIIDPPYWNWREKGLKEDDVKVAHACYCGEISMVDRWVGRLLDKVKVMGLWDKTVILFTSDHGFYFGEHGLFGKWIRERLGYQHQSPLYQEVTRIPLLVHVPGIKAKRVRALVSAVDIMPTLLELAGAEIPKRVQGKSFVPVLKGKTDTFRDFTVTSMFLYEQGHTDKSIDGIQRVIKDPHFSAITTSKWTFLYSTQDYPAHLYNIENDPQESQNVIDKHWQVAEDLHQKFVLLLEEVGTDERYLASRRHLRKA